MQNDVPSKEIEHVLFDYQNVNGLYQDPDKEKIDSDTEVFLLFSDWISSFPEFYPVLSDRMFRLSHRFFAVCSVHKIFECSLYARKYFKRFLWYYQQLFPELLSEFQNQR